MTTSNDLDRFRPPEKPLAMPYQILERPRPAIRLWFAAALRIAAREAPRE